MIDVQWGNKKIPLRFDRHPYPSHQPSDVEQCSNHQGYEPEVINVLERFAEPGDCVIDAGASIGFHTCLLSKLVGETGLVLAFEPHFESFRYLCHHVHVANNLNNVACLRMALWKHDIPSLELWSVADIGYSSFHRYSAATSSEIVEGRALDTLLIETHDHPRLIKIDCEGTESEILCGAQKILERGVDCVVLELNYHLLTTTGRSDHAIRGYMAALGYEMFIINVGDGNGGFVNPIKIDPTTAIQLTGGHHINVMFSTEEKVKERWKMCNT